MSAYYNCIITKEPIDVPVEIPHFRKGDVLTIPLNFEESLVDTFIDDFQSGKLILNDHDNCRLVFDILKRLNLANSSFIFLHHEEFADCPDTDYAAFDKGKVVEGTYFTTGIGGDGDHEAAWTYIGISEQDYYSVDWYHIAEADYRLNRNSDNYLRYC